MVSAGLNPYQEASMNRRQKGELATLKAETRAIEKDAVISRPTTEARYDFIVDFAGCLSRVQVKYAGGKSTSSRGNVVVDFRSRNGTRKSVSSCYKKSEIDVMLVYVPQIDKILWFGPEVFDGKSTLTIRLEAPMNNQKAGLFIASDYVW
jgi:hypothetical protein